MSVLKAPKQQVEVETDASLLSAVVLALSCRPAMAQTAPARPRPGTQKPAAPRRPRRRRRAAPAAQTPAAPAPAPPKPFPEGAKIAYVNVQAIASNSVEGKAATAKLDEFRKKKAGELGREEQGAAGRRRRSCSRVARC